MALLLRHPCAAPLYAAPSPPGRGSPPVVAAPAAPVADLYSRSGSRARSPDVASPGYARKTRTTLATPCAPCETPRSRPCTARDSLPARRYAPRAARWRRGRRDRSAQSWRNSGWLTSVAVAVASLLAAQPRRRSDFAIRRSLYVIVPPLIIPFRRIIDQHICPRTDVLTLA